MHPALLKEIETLRAATVGQLREKYREVFQEESRSYHKEFLFRRIAWRLQALAEGDLSERARRRALEIADDADLRVRAPKGVVPGHGSEVERYDVHRRVRGKRDPRLPKPGTLLTREFDGRTVVVQVLEKGFEFEGRSYQSLSAVARAIAGTRWNGYGFFGLTGHRNEDEKRK